MKTFFALSLFSVVAFVSSASLANDVRVYIGTSGSKGIYFASLSTATGTLSEPKLAIEIDRPGFLAIHPNKRFVYATTSDPSGTKTGGVAALAINDDGTLTLLNKQSSEGQGPCHVSVDATGKCVMVANYGSGGVAALAIGDDGSLHKSTSAHQHEGAGQNERRQKGPHAHSIYPNPDNKFAFAPDLGIDKVMIYRLQPDSATLASSGAAIVPGGGRGPRHMKFSDDGQTAYVLNELARTVTVFQIGTKPGQLVYKSELSTLPDDADKEGMSCSEIRIHRNGKFVYAANRDIADRGRDSIAIFRSQSHPGGFERIEVVPAQVSVPRNFNIDPSGNWLLVGGQRSSDIAIFKVDSKNGKLEFTGRKVPFDGGPICFEFFDG